jgi:hypothetical protein
MSAALKRISLFILVFALSASAQKQTVYRLGRLLKVSSETYVLPDAIGKIQYLLHLSDGSNEYFALYSVNPIFGHDRSDLLKPDTDVQYRISGKTLFVRTPDGKEVKGRLCEKGTFHGFPGMKCGGDIFGGGDTGSQAP